MARRDDNDDPIVVAIDSFSAGHHVVVEGNTYRSSYPPVRGHPDRFVPWLDTTTGEREAAARALAQRERVRVGLPV